MQQQQTGSQLNQEQQPPATAEAAAGTAAPASAAPVASAAASPLPKRRSRWRRLLFKFLLLLLFLPLLGLSGYLLYQQGMLESRPAAEPVADATPSGNGATEPIAQTPTASFQQPGQQSQPQLQQQLQQLQESQQQMAEEIRRLSEAIESPLSADDPTLAAAVGRLDSALQLLDERLVALQRQQSGPEPDWKLREAELLLGLAARRLQLAGDVSAAITLLQDADIALTASRIGLGNPGGVLEARQAIAADIATLQEVGQLDRDGIYLRLDRLQQDLNRFDLLAALRGDSIGYMVEPQQAEQPAQAEPIAQAQPRRPLDFLASVFVWRKRSPDSLGGLQAGLLPEQEALLKQRLHLLLEQAKLALYARDNPRYQTTLAAVSAELQQHGFTETQAGQTALEELQQLQAMDIDPALPGLARSAALLAQLAAAQD